MIFEKIDNLIADAMLQHKNDELKIYRLMKNEFVKFEKTGKKIDDNSEITILNKMKTQREESCNIYKTAGRNDLAEIEENEIKIISNFLPPEMTNEEKEKRISEIINNFEEKMAVKVSMKDMKTILPLIQKEIPGINGKIVSDIIKNR